MLVRSQWGESCHFFPLSYQPPPLNSPPLMGVSSEQRRAWVLRSVQLSGDKSEQAQQPEVPPLPRRPPTLVSHHTSLLRKTKYKQFRIILRTRCLFTFQNCRYGKVLRPTTAINNNLGQSLLGEAAFQHQRQKPISSLFLCSGTGRLFISS